MAFAAVHESPVGTGLTTSALQRGLSVVEGPPDLLISANLCREDRSIGLASASGHQIAQCSGYRASMRGTSTRRRSLWALAAGRLARNFLDAGAERVRGQGIGLVKY